MGTEFFVTITIISCMFLVCTTILLCKLLKERCHHEWEEKERYGGSVGDRIVKQVIVMRCKKCGDLCNHVID